MASINGIEVVALGKALRKLCWSEGITIKQLALDSKVHERVILGFFTGEPISEEKIKSVIGAFYGAVRDEIKTPATIIEAAAQIPEITRESVDAAVHRLEQRQAISHKEMMRRRKQLMLPGGYQGKPTRLADFESDFYTAKVLGCSSIGEMLLEAEEIPQLRYSEKSLVKAVETLRIARNIPITEFAPSLGLSESGYHFSIRSKNFSPSSKARLLTALGLNNSGALNVIFDEVNKLEPLPDREVFGASVKKVRMHSALSQEVLASEMGCNVETLKRIEGVNNHGVGEPSSGWLRKVPLLIGCSSMQQVIEMAASLGEISHIARIQKNRSPVIGSMVSQLR